MVFARRGKEIVGSLWLGLALALGITLLGAGVVLAMGPGSLCNTPATAGCAGATALAQYNSTHYALPLGAAITGKIVGATDLAGTTTTVFIKRQDGTGNSVVDSVPGTVSGGVITFSYTAPSAGNVCATSVVAYETNGNNTNNDVIDDLTLNGSGGSAGGYAFVDANGNTLPCGPTAVTLTSFDADSGVAGWPAAAGLVGLFAALGGVVWARTRVK